MYSQCQQKLSKGSLLTIQHDRSFCLRCAGLDHLAVLAVRFSRRESVMRGKVCRSKWQHWHSQKKNVVPINVCGKKEEDRTLMQAMQSKFLDRTKQER